MRISLILLVLVVYEASSQNVGVNIATPRSRFHVNGTSWFQGDNTPLPSSAGKGLAIGFTGEQGYIFGWDYASFTPRNIFMQHGGGNLGVGTTAPAAKLHVVSSGGRGIEVSTTGTFALAATSTGQGTAAIDGRSPYVGVQAYCTGTDINRQAIRAENLSGSQGGYAGIFVGTTWVVGTLVKNAGSFMIDHPLDPHNKFLSHSFVESPDMKNIYDGVVTTGTDSKATVILPEWFQALNKDFRYQLTVIGQFAQAIVKSEIDNNQFTIQTDKPGVKVSWQVTGIRKDAYAEQNRIQVETWKPQDQRGKYIYPAGVGKTDESKIEVLQSQIKADSN